MHSQSKNAFFIHQMLIIIFNILLPILTLSFFSRQSPQLYNYYPHHRLTTFLCATTISEKVNSLLFHPAHAFPKGHLHHQPITRVTTLTILFSIGLTAAVPLATPKTRRVNVSSHFMDSINRSSPFTWRSFPQPRRDGGWT